MSHTEFEPFGEFVPGSLRTPDSSPGLRRTGSRLAMRAGVGLFWTLVIAVVGVRVTYFDPDVASTLSGHAITLAKAVCALFA